MAAVFWVVVKWCVLILFGGPNSPLRRAKSTSRKCERLYPTAIAIPVNGASTADRQHTCISPLVITPASVLNCLPQIAHHLLAHAVEQLGGGQWRELNLLLKSFEAPNDHCACDPCRQIEASPCIDLVERNFVRRLGNAPFQTLDRTSLRLQRQHPLVRRHYRAQARAGD